MLGWRLYAVIFIVLVIGIVCAGFGAFYDAQKYCNGDQTCRFFQRFQWESILAGFLGLMGGLVVLYTTRQQMQQNTRLAQDQRDLAIKMDIDKGLFNLFEFIAEAKRYEKIIREYIGLYRPAPAETSAYETAIKQDTQLARQLAGIEITVKNAERFRRSSAVPVHLDRQITLIISNLETCKNRQFLAPWDHVRDGDGHTKEDIDQLADNITKFHETLEQYRNDLFLVRHAPTKQTPV